MARKSKEIQSRLKIVKQQAEEEQRLLEMAIKEEEDTIKSITDKINKICTDAGLFCGVILTKQDLLGVIQVALENKDTNLEIPFRLYNKDV